MTRLARYEDVDLDGPLSGFVYERREGIAFITLQRPQRGNSLTPAMHAIARKIWSDVRDNPAVRVAIFSAAGERHFSTGFDVSEAAGEEADEVFIDRPLGESVFWSPKQNDVQKPVICVVTGLCVGGGHHFVVDADIVLASKNAAFTDTHVNVGMVGAIENIGLAKRLPIGTALRMTLVGKSYRLSAERAHQLGLVDELLDTPEQARAAAEAMAREILKNSPRAMALSKQAVWSSVERGYADALEYGWERLREMWTHPDFVEGPRAFAEKREPRWDIEPTATLGDEK
jgi:enoyl-CoA hydratase/carnithine racemase